MPASLSVVPAQLQATPRRWPFWGPNWIQTIVVAGVIWLFLGPLLIAPFFAANPEAVGLMALMFGGPLFFVFVFQQLKARRRRHLFRHGPIAAAEIIAVRGRRNYEVRCQLNWEGKSYDVLAGHSGQRWFQKTLGKLPQPGETAFFVVDTKRPKRSECWGYALGSRFWVPGM